MFAKRQTERSDLNRTRTNQKSAAHRPENISGNIRQALHHTSAKRTSKSVGQEEQIYGKIWEMCGMINT